MQSICIVIPTYNEGKRLPLQKFIDYIEKNDIFFCFINDGSTDNTQDVLMSIHALFPQKTLIISNETNIGKAEGIRKGIYEALQWKPFDYVGYFDADYATPLDEIQHLMNVLNNNPRFSFALGCRLNRLGASIKRKPIRHYFSRVFATVASIILKMPVYDTQCGAKIIESSLAKAIFKDPFYSKWLFDIELIARVRNNFDSSKIIEVPLNSWEEIGDTKIRLKDLFKMPLEFYRISKHYN